MKITLLYPPVSSRERYNSSIGSSGGRQIPLGIYYLASYVREKGHSVQAVDAEAECLTARECIEKTISFALSLPMSVMSVTLNTPLPDSPQHKEWRQYGTLDRADWSNFNYWSPVFVPTGLDRTLLLQKQKEFYRRFYFRPRIIFDHLKTFCRPSGFKRFWSLFKALPFVLFGK